MWKKTLTKNGNGFEKNKNKSHAPVNDQIPFSILNFNFNKKIKNLINTNVFYFFTYVRVCKSLWRNCAQKYFIARVHPTFMSSPKKF